MFLAKLKAYHCKTSDGSRHLLKLAKKMEQLHQGKVWRSWSHQSPGAEVAQLSGRCCRMPDSWAAQVWKTSCLVPVPKKTTPPVTLMSKVMKVKRLVLARLNLQVKHPLDLLQFASCRDEQQCYLPFAAYLLSPLLVLVPL